MRELRTLAACAFAAAAFFALAAEAAAAPCTNFNGFYAGANVGYGSYDTTWTDVDNWVDRFSTDISLAGSVQKRDGSANAGVQAGYNMQTGCALLGVEADWNWSNVDVTNTYTADGDLEEVVTLVDELNWFGTLRGRAGVAVDQLLLFGTAGLAFADLDHSWRVVDTVLPATEAFGASDTRWGFAAGGGGEWALSNQLSIKGEALYLSFSEDTTRAFSTRADENMRWNNLDSLWVVRAGVNYHFSL